MSKIQVENSNLWGELSNELCGLSMTGLWENPYVNYGTLLV